MPVTHQQPAGTPTITNARNRARTPHKLFVNVPVNDIQATIRFFEALGFNFSPQFTDATATSMPVGEDAYLMFLTKERFAGFAKAPVGDPKQATSHLLTISVNSREEVDETVKKAIAAGGSTTDEPEDHGFMYDWSFRDLDGHAWGVFWMDPSAIPADA